MRFTIVPSFISPPASEPDREREDRLWLASCSFALELNSSSQIFLLELIQSTPQSSVSFSNAWTVDESVASWVLTFSSTLMRISFLMWGAYHARSANDGIWALAASKVDSSYASQISLRLRWPLDSILRDKRENKCFLSHHVVLLPLMILYRTAITAISRSR
jgi:hypothetical protein